MKYKLYKRIIKYEFQFEHKEIDINDSINDLFNNFINELPIEAINKIRKLTIDINKAVAYTQLEKEFETNFQLNKDDKISLYNKNAKEKYSYIINETNYDIDNNIKELYIYSLIEEYLNKNDKIIMKEKEKQLNKKLEEYKSSLILLDTISDNQKDDEFIDDDWDILY